MTNLIDHCWFKIFFWIVAISFSIFYSAKAFEIHNDTRPKSSKPFIFHQYWLNFLGSFAGWSVFWIVLPSLFLSMDMKRTEILSLKDIILLIVAFLGMTGHLPMALVGVAAGFKDLIERLFKK